MADDIRLDQNLNQQTPPPPPPPARPVEDMFASTEALGSSRPVMPQPTPVSSRPAVSVQEHVMNSMVPDKEEIAELTGSKSFSNKQKIILLIVAILVVCGLGAGGYFLYTNISTVVGGNENTNKVVNNSVLPVLNKNVNKVLNANTPVVVNTNTNAIANANVNKINTNLNTNTVVIKDTDNDGLSDTLEVTWGTDMRNPDTDGDGFKDGDEVKNGYNPLGAGKFSVPQSNLPKQ